MKSLLFTALFTVCALGVMAQWEPLFTDSDVLIGKPYSEILAKGKQFKKFEVKDSVINFARTMRKGYDNINFIYNRYFFERAVCNKIIMVIDSDIPDKEVLSILKDKYIFNGRDSTKVQKQVTITESFESPSLQVAFKRKWSDSSDHQRYLVFKPKGQK